VGDGRHEHVVVLSFVVTVFERTFDRLFGETKEETGRLSDQIGSKYENNTNTGILWGKHVTIIFPLTLSSWLPRCLSNQSSKINLWHSSRILRSMIMDATTPEDSEGVAIPLYAVNDSTLNSFRDCFAFELSTQGRPLWR
jgi:hypothetical protein